MKLQVAAYEWDKQPLSKNYTAVKGANKPTDYRKRYDDLVY